MDDAGVSVKKDGKFGIMEASGHFDQSNSDKFGKGLEDLLKLSTKNNILVLKDAQYLSSAAWGILVGEIKRFRENERDIKIAAMNPEVNDVYQMLEFYHLIDEHTTVDEAKESYN